MSVASIVCWCVPLLLIPPVFEVVAAEIVVEEAVGAVVDVGEEVEVEDAEEVVGLCWVNLAKE